MPIIPFPTTPLCSVCKKRTATILCDFPIRKIGYIGHPPRTEMLEAQNMHIAYKKVEMNKTITCDKPLCNECAIQMGNGIDFCPIHIHEMKIKKER